MRKGSRDISIDRLPHKQLRSSRGEVGGKTARPLWQRPVRSAGAKDSRSPSPPPPQSRRDGEGLQVPSRRVRAKTSAEQRNLPGLPRYQAALPTPFSSSFALTPRLFVPQNARRNHRRAEPRRAAHPSPPAKPPSPGPLRRGGERGRGPGRGGRTGGRLCLPGAAERRGWPRRSPPGTAGPHRAAQGGRGRTAVAGGLWRVPTPASGIPGAPIPSQCRSGLAPSRRGGRSRVTSAPEGPAPPSGGLAPLPGCPAPHPVESCPGGPVRRSLEVQPGDPAPQPRCPGGPSPLPARPRTLPGAPVPHPWDRTPRPESYFASGGSRSVPSGGPARTRAPSLDHAWGPGCAALPPAATYQAPPDSCPLAHDTGRQEPAWGTDAAEAGPGGSGPAQPPPAPGLRQRGRASSASAAGPHKLNCSVFTFPLLCSNGAKYHADNDNAGGIDLLLIH